MWGTINFDKVITGGLVAGVGMNALDVVMKNVLMKSQCDAVNVARNSDSAVAESAIPAYIAIDFLSGILAVFMCAATRPRFGAGPP